MTSANSHLHLLWIYSGSLDKAMDAATWLKTVKELRNWGLRVTLVDTGPKGNRILHGVEVLHISRPEIYLLRQVIFHIKVLYFIMQRLRTIDIILFHEVSAFWILPLRFVRRMTGRSRPLLVMDTRSLPMPDPNKETWKDKIRNSAYVITSQLGNYYADGRLAITKHMAVAAHIPTEKLWGIWPSGADVEYFGMVRSNRRWPLSGDPIHLVYHGSMHHERNLLTLCKAVMQANADQMSFRLSLIGDGTQRTELEHFTSQTNGAIRVIYKIPYEEIPDILAQSHIGVLCFPNEKKFRVSSPIKLFEYMAAGMPILVTRITCHTDVVGNGKYAFWAEEADEQGLLDALHQVWHSHDSLSEMGRQAALAAEAWTWKASAKKLMDALEKGYRSKTPQLETNPV